MQKEKLKEFLSYTDAILESMRKSIEGDKQNLWKYSSYKEYMRKSNQLIIQISKLIKIETIVDLFDLEKIPGSFDTTTIHQKRFFDSVYTNLSILKSFLENKLELKKSEITNLKYFFQSNLRKSIFETPSRESDIQDTIEKLLIGRGFSKGIDYDREKGRIKISIKEVIPDFIFPKLDLALEVKLSKNKTKIKVIIDEINADIKMYSKKFSNQLFVIYDMGSIRDEDEFKSDLDNNENISLIVVKH